MGSSLFLLGYFFFLVNFFSLVRSIVPFIFIFLSLLIKLGAAPFHFWFPIIIKGISWFSCGILMVPQKIIPIFILRCILMGGFSSILGLFRIIGAIVGGVGGFNQVNLRYILSYSSIGHIGWILIGCLCSFNIFFIYFFVYAIISLGIITLIHLNDLSKVLSDSIYFKGFFIGIILFFFISLRGIPPFLGFLPKWLIIEALSNNSLFLVGFFILLGSLVNIFYYLKVIINILLRIFNLRQGRIFNYKYNFILSLLRFSRVFLLGLFYIFYA